MALFHMILAATALAFEPEAPVELNPIMRRQDFNSASLLESDSKQPYQAQSMPVPNPFQQLEAPRAHAPNQVPVFVSQDVSTTQDFFAERSDNSTDSSTTLTPREKQTQLLLNGCVMPQWKKDDYLCLEHEHVRAFRDYRGVLRKKLQDGENCTVGCPHLRFWQAPNVPELSCKEGQLLSRAGTAPVAIRCVTSDHWWNVLILHIILTPLLCLYCLYACGKRMLSGVKPATPSVTEQASVEPAATSTEPEARRPSAASGAAN